MSRLRQLAFAFSFAALCWLAMMAVHELGHVVGAVCTGGSVTRVIVHPFRISRTDVAPNPRPGVVVWSGPIAGSLLPCGLALLAPRRKWVLRKLAGVWAGFCLIANGAYIGLGSLDGVGDCGQMLRTGTPFWVLPAFGLVTIPLGLLFWHRLGSLSRFVREASLVTGPMAYGTCGLLAVVVVLEFSFSAQ